MRIAFNPSTVAALTAPPNNKDITFDLRGRNIFARGVKFYGTDTNTWRDIKINNVSIGSHTLDLRNGSNTTLSNTNGIVTINSTWRPVVDNLTSNSTTSSLSANQGRVLAGLINGKSDSDHNHDGRYVRKSGDTMSGVLTIDTTNFGALAIKRSDDVNGASIQFRGKSNIYGYIGLNNSTKDKQFLRWNSDASKVYTILDTSSTYTSSGKGIINGTTITQVDNATNATNSTNARKLVNWYSARPTSLNAQFGDGSLRIFHATSSTTEGKPAEDSHILHLAWDNTGGWDAQLAVHTHSGKVSTRAQNNGTWGSWKTLAFTTDIPSSLKNPHSFNVFGVTYDGSAAKTVTTSTFISQVNEGTSTITDGTMLITSYASNSGFADTNAVNVPYKRKAIHLWEYIKTKTDSLYTVIGHTHDDRYLRLIGGTMTGTINRRSGGSTISGRDHAIIRQTYAPGGSSWNPIACVDTETGTWTLGHLSAGSSNTDFSFCFSTNADYNAGNNNGNYVTLRNRVGTIALTSEIPNKNSWNYDDRYYTKAESNAKYITDIITSVNKLTFAKNGSSIARTITVNNVQSLGKRSPLTERNAISGIYTYGTYSATDNLAPTNYFETLGFGEGAGGTIEIGGSWISGGKLYWRALRDCCEDWFSWKTILDSSNYSSILDSRYYTESEVNSLLSKKLDRVNLSVGSWNPRGYHLAADYCYNGGNLSISENGSKMYVSIDGQFYQNEGQYRVLDTSDIGNIRGSLTLNQYLSSTDTSWYPLVWGGDTHKNTNNSTGSLYKSYDKLSWQTSSQTLYTTHLRTTYIDLENSRGISQVTSGGTSPYKGIKLPNLQSSGIGIFSRTSNSSDEGGIIISEDTSVIYNSFDTGWGLSVRDKDRGQTDISGDGTIAFGVRQDYRAYSLGGFEKSGSNNSYVLLGGGGHKLESALRVAYASSSNLATTASSANKLTTARNIALGTDLRGSANFDGSGNITIYANINACKVQVGSTNGLPFKRIAHFETGSSWNDNALLLYISQGYINGSNGICRVEFRTDNISSSNSNPSASSSVRWLVRNGYNLDSLYAGYYVTTGKAYIDIYLKTTGGYQGTVIRVLQDSRGDINSNVQLINSHYYSDTNHKEAYGSIEAASTALYNRAYTRIVSGSDIGTVSYSNSTGSVHWNNVTNKPSTFNPAAHTHTVFRNNLMIKGTNGVSDSASIHLGIGDSDTGFKWISDGVCQIYANNVAIGQWTSGGMNWFRNPTVNGNKVWNAGNDGSGSGLDADTTDGVHINWSGTNDNPTYLASWDNNGKAIRAATRANITVGNSDKLDGYHENSFLRYRGATNKDQEATLWSQIGIKEYQKALPDSLTSVYNFGSVISLPGLYSRFEIYASHQSSTGNGLYYRSGWANDKQPWRKFIDSSNIGSQSVNYANSAGSASSADKTRALKYTGTGSSEITAHQTDASYMGRSGWASYIICNHGNGSTYYSQTIAFPFWGSPIYRRLEGGTDRGWKKFYTEENPPSWDNVTNKPSSFTPSSHTHSWASITDKIVAGNEFNIVNAGFKEGMWFNYLPINDRSKTATISSYHFGNGARGYASIVASGFIKSGGNASQLLRADGGVAAFNWSGQSGQPTWLWGGNSQHSYYVYNPSNFRVAYASKAGSVAWANVTGKPTIPNPTDYYWANIKVSASSNTQTKPSVNTIYANNWFRSQGASGWYSESYGGGIYMSDTAWIRTFGDKPFYCNKQIYSSDSIRMGDIYLQNKNEINNGANGDLHLNYRNTGDIILCNGGGKVGIGKSDPLYKLDVAGNGRFQDFVYCNAVYSNTLNHTSPTGHLIIGNKTKEISIRSSYLPDVPAVYLYQKFSTNVYYTANKGFGIRPYYLSSMDYRPTETISGNTYSVVTVGDSVQAISCIIADKANIISQIRGTLIRFLPGDDGQIVLLKDLNNYGSINGYFYVQPKGCNIIGANNSNIHIADGNISDACDDGKSRFFIYAKTHKVWIEFYCG